MHNPLHLIPGKKYRIVRPFTDYDQQTHLVGEEWTFISTHFLPYDDGLALRVELENTLAETMYRRQWRPEEQANIVEHFTDYVAPC